MNLRPKLSFDNEAIKHVDSHLTVRYNKTWKFKIFRIEHQQCFWKRNPTTKYGGTRQGDFIVG